MSGQGESKRGRGRGEAGGDKRGGKRGRGGKSSDAVKQSKPDEKTMTLSSPDNQVVPQSIIAELGPGTSVIVTHPPPPSVPSKQISVISVDDDDSSSNSSEDTSNALKGVESIQIIEDEFDEGVQEGGAQIVEEEKKRSRQERTSMLAGPSGLGNVAAQLGMVLGAGYVNSNATPSVQEKPTGAIPKHPPLLQGNKQKIIRHRNMSPRKSPPKNTKEETPKITTKAKLMKGSVYRKSGASCSSQLAAGIPTRARNLSPQKTCVNKEKSPTIEPLFLQGSTVKIADRPKEKGKRDKLKSAAVRERAETSSEEENND